MKISNFSFKKISSFLKDGIWHVERNEVGPIGYFALNVARKLILAIEFTTERRITSAACALTYSTLLAIVPILAVVFAIARGFGYNKYIEIWFRDALSSQPQAADIIVGFVNSYLVHTQRGIFLGVGLVFMLFTVIMLIRNIEETFNGIWQVKKPRSVFRTITDYTSMFLLMPIIIVVTSGISIFFATIFKNIEDTMVIGPLMECMLHVLPYAIMSAIFTALYVFMPNTKVKISSAIAPGIISGVAMQGLQLIYINSQIWVSSYNAIYGSFAALPLFMLWVQISWLICLFGAELCYASQNMEDYAFKAQTNDLSHKDMLGMCILLASKICKRFADGKKSYTALDLKIETKLPIRIVNELLFCMTKVGILNETACRDKDDIVRYQPAECLTRLSVGLLIERMEKEGNWTPSINCQTELTEAWETVAASYTDYLETQKKVLLKDL